MLILNEIQSHRELDFTCILLWPMDQKKVISSWVLAKMIEKSACGRQAFRVGLTFFIF